MKVKTWIVKAKNMVLDLWNTWKAAARYVICPQSLLEVLTRHSMLKAVVVLHILYVCECKWPIWWCFRFQSTETMYFLFTFLTAEQLRHVHQHFLSHFKNLLIWLLVLEVRIIHYVSCQFIVVLLILLELVWLPRNHSAALALSLLTKSLTAGASNITAWVLLHVAFAVSFMWSPWTMKIMKCV